MSAEAGLAVEQLADFDASQKLWLVTLAAVGVAILIDLFSHRKPSYPGMKESLIAATAWTLLGVVIGPILGLRYGSDVAAQYLSGYLLERTLSVDNVFVFVMILDFFAVPAVLRHRALLFGVVVALTMRAFFIGIGGALLESFWWMTFVFGGFLVFTAVKLIQQNETHVNPDANPVLRLVKKIRPLTPDFDGYKLKVKRDGVVMFTPLFVTLFALGTTDVVFAIDSIPAIFAVTSSTFIVFAANAFALMGLIPLTFLLANAVDRFAYLKHALAIVLAYVGAKMIVSGFGYHIDTLITLAVVIVVLTGGIVYSLYKTRDAIPETTPK